MRCCMIEPAKTLDAGSIGTWYVAEAARAAGHDVEMIRRSRRGYDIEMVSLHHCNDYAKFVAMPRSGKIRIVGGHVMANNPRPLIPFADVICVGEGESWIVEALDRLERNNLDVDCLACMPGTIICKDWRLGNQIPAPNIERPLPHNKPYLNRPDTLSAAWYVEIARGCPYSCKFCELGHSLPFRLYTPEEIEACLDQADTSITRKINFYAPDEASHPKYDELYEMLRRRGFNAGFASMRIESVLRRGLPDIPTNQLIRVGIDGLTESTRRAVGKPITDDMIVEYFDYMTKRGHVTYKMFFIVGYPWETAYDFDQFERLMERIFRLPMTKNLSLRIKWTPFIPQPVTPLADAEAQYNYELMDRIMIWHALHKQPRIEPGWYVTMDGDVLMSERSHAEQIKLTRGDEQTLLDYPGAKPLR